MQDWTWIEYVTIIPLAISVLGPLIFGTFLIFILACKGIWLEFVKTFKEMK